MILDAITSPFNVFFTIVLGLGLVYWYYRKPSSSTSRRAVEAEQITDEELQRIIERQERDMIRQEQDAAYEESLRADREKRIKREQEMRDREAKEKAERERLLQQEDNQIKLVQLKSIIVDKLPKEPVQDEIENVRLVFKLPDGTRVKRKFHKEDRIKFLYWYVFSLDNAPLKFKMTTNFPKRDLPGRPPAPEDFEVSSPKLMDTNSEMTLAEAGLTGSQILFVCDLDA